MDPDPDPDPDPTPPLTDTSMTSQPFSSYGHENCCCLPPTGGSDVGADGGGNAAPLNVYKREGRSCGPSGLCPENLINLSMGKVEDDHPHVGTPNICSFSIPMLENEGP